MEVHLLMMVLDRDADHIETFSRRWRQSAGYKVYRDTSAEQVRNGCKGVWVASKDLDLWLEALCGYLPKSSSAKGLGAKHIQDIKAKVARFKATATYGAIKRFSEV